MAGQQPRSSVAVFSLAVVLLVLATIAVVAAAVVVASDRFTSVAGAWVSPLSAIKAETINPSFALGSLAGVNDQDIVERSIAAASVDAALSTLLYSTSLTDQARAGGLLSVGRRLVQDSRQEEALLASHTAADVALLSPTMPDYARAVALNQAGQVIAQTGKKDEAANYYHMAATIALHSRRIDSSYRQLLIDGLATDYTHLGHQDEARSLRSALQSAPPALDKSPYVLPTLLVPLVPDSSSAWASLQAATARRVDSAAALIASLQGQSAASSATARQALEKALIEEDQLCDQVYGNGITHSDNLLQRVAYARARTEWLALKWRVARRGFGLSLVPAWESQVSDIEARLHKAGEDYYLILRDAAISLPSQADAAQAAVDIIQDQIKMGRLGMPPNTHEAGLINALDKAWQQRLALGGSNLYITVNNEKGATQLSVVSNQ